MTSYYNEFDPNAAAWLRELIKQGHIAPGEVDERSIEDVRPDDLRGFTQCHFFAGIGGWSLALRMAGWPDSRPVWTGSCPCQPFSAAGKGAGFDDERHLWPAFHHLIKECQPAAVFGEQVDAALKSGWWDLVANDLESLGYATAAAVIPASAVGAPHMRHRLFFVALCDELRAGNMGRSAASLDAGSLEKEKGILKNDAIDVIQAHGKNDNDTGWQEDSGNQGVGAPHIRQRLYWVADGSGPGLEGRNAGAVGNERQAAERGGCAGGMADAERERRERREGVSSGGVDDRKDARRIEDNDGPLGGNETGISRIDCPGPTNGFWGAADWLACRDGKFRPVEPGTFPLVDGAAARVVRGGSDGLPIDSDKTGEARVMRLRGYGNSINAVAAKAFIEAFMGYQRDAS